MPTAYRAPRHDLRGEGPRPARPPRPETLPECRRLRPGDRVRVRTGHARGLPMTVLEAYPDSALLGWQSGGRAYRGRWELWRLECCR